MTATETQTVNLALGRIFRMASRPTQEGDVAEYERCRSLILNLLDPEVTPHVEPHCYGRDRNKGAQGD